MMPCHEICTKFLCSMGYMFLRTGDVTGIIITTNKVVSTLELQTIEKYINNMDTNDITTSRLPQSILFENNRYSLFE